LTLGFAEKARLVSAAHVESAATDLQLVEKHQPPVAAPVKAPVKPAPPAVRPMPVNGQSAAVKTIDRSLEPPRKQSVFQTMAGKFWHRSNGQKPAL
jgi:hypothetical protein